MPPRKTPPPDEAEQLRELVREAHEVIKDLKTELREARAFIKDIVADVLQEHVVAGLAEYDDSIKQAMITAAQHVEEQFQQLFDRYMGTNDDDSVQRLSLEQLLQIRQAINQIEQYVKHMNQDFFDEDLKDFVKKKAARQPQLPPIRVAFVPPFSDTSVVVEET